MNDRMDIETVKVIAMTAQKTYNFFYGKFRDKEANYQYEILKDIVE